MSQIAVLKNFNQSRGLQKTLGGAHFSVANRKKQSTITPIICPEVRSEPSKSSLYEPVTERQKIIHAPGHVNCEPCEREKNRAMLKPSAEMLLSVASQCYIDLHTVNVPNGKARYVSPRTLQDYSDFGKALNVFFGATALHSIHWGTLREYQRLRAIGGEGEIKWKHPAGPNKITKEIGYLIRIMKLAGCWTAELESNFFHLQHVESDIGRALTQAEQDHWIATASSNERWHFIWYYSLLAIHSMASTNELRGIRLGDINLFSHVLQIRSGNVKNKYRIRTASLTDEACWAVERLKERAESLGATLPQHFLFPWKQRNADPARSMTVSGLKKRWAEVRQESGIDWRPSDTRHTGCTRMAEAGEPIHVIMSQAGHVSPRMQQHYIHIAESVKRKSVQRAFSSVGNRGGYVNASK